jgi:hypothetical protein
MSSPPPSRYKRQRRLFEVGDVGQARIEAGAVLVRGTDLAAEQCALYLAAAGLAAVRVESPALAAKLHALRTDFVAAEHTSLMQVEPALNAVEREAHALLADPVAAAVYSGAIAALRVLRALIEPASTKG